MAEPQASMTMVAETQNATNSARVDKALEHPTLLGTEGYAHITPNGPPPPLLKWCLRVNSHPDIEQLISKLLFFLFVPLLAYL